MPARPSVVDSSIFIPYFRSDTYGPLIRRLFGDGRLVLSSVVAAELLAGALNRGALNVCRQLFRRAQSQGLIAPPEHGDWLQAGELLARYARRFGAVDAAKHFPDILIVLTARRLGAELLTDNLSDMTTWARMLDPRDRRVPVVKPRPA